MPQLVIKNNLLIFLFTAKKQMYHMHVKMKDCTSVQYIYYKVMALQVCGLMSAVYYEKAKIKILYFCLLC